MKKYFIGVFYCACAAGGLFIGYETTLKVYDVLMYRPTVYFSWKTKQCVDVQDWNDKPGEIRPAYTCENLPKKFKHEWVE